jgi:hypothetical protein
MSTDETLKLALEALRLYQRTLAPVATQSKGVAAVAAIEQARSAPVQEPVAHQIIAGALFDFMGFLITQNERLMLSSADNASPVGEAITNFAKMRGLSLDDARVEDWEDTILPAAQPAVPDAITDNSESPDYREGWNDCRQAMMEMMK